MRNLKITFLAIIAFGVLASCSNTSDSTAEKSTNDSTEVKQAAVTNEESENKEDAFQTTSSEEQVKGNLKIVKIGSREWMAENLNVSTYSNGDAIPEAKTDADWKSFGDKGEGCWCYYNFDAGYGKKYGKLYNWFAVKDSRGLAPDGWMIPSDTVWAELVTSAGGTDKAAKVMKTTTGWKENGNGDNSIGFNAQAGSNKEGDGFMYEGLNGFWWSSTSLPDVMEGLPSMGAWGMNIFHKHDACQKFQFQKTSGLSVRCVKK